MRHRRRRRRREVPRRAVRRVRSIEWVDRWFVDRSIDDPSIAPFARSTVRRSRVDRALDRRSVDRAEYAFFRAVEPRFDLGAIAPTRRARGRTPRREGR
jgi:hypothetical protein